MLPLPEKREPYEIAAILILGVLLALAGQRISALSVQPEIQEKTVYKIEEGPSRTTKRTITKPDGEKIVEQIREVEHRTVERESDKSEKPVFAPSRGRYVGLGVDPFDYARVPRLRAGLSIFEILDVGVAYDYRRRLNDGALMCEVAYRF